MSTHRACCGECSACRSEVVFRNGTPSTSDTVTTALRRGQVYTFNTSAREIEIDGSFPENNTDTTSTSAGRVGVSLQYGRAPTDAEVIADWSLGGFATKTILGAFERPLGSGVYWRLFTAYTEVINNGIGPAAPALTFTGTLNRFGPRLTLPVLGPSGTFLGTETTNTGGPTAQASRQYSDLGAGSSREVLLDCSIALVASMLTYPPSYLGTGTEIDCTL